MPAFKCDVCDRVYNESKGKVLLTSITWARCNECKSIVTSLQDSYTFKEGVFSLKEVEAKGMSI